MDSAANHFTDSLVLWIKRMHLRMIDMKTRLEFIVLENLHVHLKTHNKVGRKKSRANKGNI